MNTQVQKRPNIALTPCASSQVHAHGFDPATGILALQFKSKGEAGPVYHYDGVKPEVYQALCEAESVGKFFGKSIKGVYPFTKLEPEQPAEDVQ